MSSASGSPRRNRVDPWGNLFADRSRGAWMGNRGILHDAEGRIVRAWQVKRWIICRLEFEGRQRRLMQPGRYTELFFWDEATALAAGHRPCAECRRDDYRAFLAAWAAANPERVGAGGRAGAGDLDAALHADRVGPDGSKRTFAADPASLPDGVMVADPESGQPYLVRAGRLWPWSSTGYGASVEFERIDGARVLTPLTTVRALEHGYPVHTRFDDE